MEPPFLWISTCEPNDAHSMPPSSLPFRSLRADSQSRPLLRKNPPPPGPLIFRPSVWRDVLPSEPPVPLRATFPFHCPQRDLTIDTVLANATSQHLHVIAPRHPPLQCCPAAWRPRSLLERQLSAFEDDFANTCDLCALLLEPYHPSIARGEGISHAPPAQYTPQERSFRKLLRHKELIEDAYAAHDLRVRQEQKRQAEEEEVDKESIEEAADLSPDGCSAQQAWELVGGEEERGLGKEELLLVSDASDDDWQLLDG